MSPTIGNDESLPEGSQPRLCLLKKSVDDQEYGFDLHADKVRGQFIGNVDSDSPAGIAGLKSGDRILAVNGESVLNQNHKDVVCRIKSEPMECRFVVIDEPGFLWYSCRKIPPPIPESLLIATRAKSVSLPANGEIKCDGNVSLGNGDLHRALEEQKSATPEKDTSENLQVSLEPAGQASETFLETCKDIMFVSQSDKSDESHEIVVNKTSCNVSTGLADEPLYCEKSPQSVPVQNGHMKLEQETNGHASEAAEELPRLCHVRKAQPDDEYGFNLHAEKNRGHFVGKVDADSVAEKAGLIQGYRIVGVNGSLVHPKTPHKDVVALIRKHGLYADLLIASPELDAEYVARSRSFSFSHAEVFTVRVEDPENKVPIEENSLSHEPDRLTEVTEKIATSVLEEREEAPKVNNLSNGTLFNSSALSSSSGVQIDSSFKKVVDTVSPADIFNMSASEMREKLSRHKKADPRLESMSIRQKYEIVKNL